MALRWVVSVRHLFLGLGIRWPPLLRTGRALRQLPLVLEQVREEAVVPLRRLVGPRALEPAGQRVGAIAAVDAVLPAEPLLLDWSGLGLRTDVLGTDRTMGLAEGVTADDKSDRLLVAHGHATERLPDVPAGGDRVRVAAGPLGVHVDEAHLNGRQRTRELPLAAVALVSEPCVLGPPEDLLGLPDVLSPEAEPKCVEAHRLHRDVPGVDQEIRPRELLPVLLLDLPEQPARLVQARVVGPAVERGEALSAAAAAAPAVGNAVRARRMPAHPDEERPIVAVVGRPPVLRRRHELEEVPPQRLEVEALELLGVVEVLAQRVGKGRVLVENREVQLIRPPIPVRPRPMRLRSRARNCQVLAFADALRQSVLLLFRCFRRMGHCSSPRLRAGARTAVQVS